MPTFLPLVGALTDTTTPGQIGLGNYDIQGVNSHSPKFEIHTYKVVVLSEGILESV